MKNGNNAVNLAINPHLLVVNLKNNIKESVKVIVPSTSNAAIFFFKTNSLIFS
jgi:hypothetical protein